MRGYKDQRLQNQPWRARSCSSKAHQSWLSSGPSHMISHRALSFGQVFIHSIRPETPTTLSIAIGPWQHFPASYLPAIPFSSSDFFLYLKVDNFRYVFLLVAHWEFSVVPAGKKSRSIKDQDKDLPWFPLAICWRPLHLHLLKFSDTLPAHEAKIRQEKPKSRFYQWVWP